MSEDDPFSSILSLVRVRSATSGGFTAGGKWAIRFPRPDKIKFFIPAKGECWLVIDGMGEPIRLRQGDVFLLATQRPFVLASDLSAPMLDAEQVFASGTCEIINIADGDDFLFLGGHVLIDNEAGRLLLDSLPPTVHLPANMPEAGTLEWLIEQLVREHQQGRLGAHFATAQLAQLMFLEILRVYVGGKDEMAVGRLRAICDPRIAPAIKLIHGDPRRDWHLAELAKAAGMSRTVFAVYFKSVAGVPPLTYLTEWRMRLAERALKESNKPLAAVASSVGYTSENAFSAAFKRVTGRAPKRYRVAIRQTFAESDVEPHLDEA
ncbi:AraC family transcriptional regulator [Pleomorphomonas carboxyditropha]|uniref:AraC family transcriptional regulator n=1 Tax=Pleomorphomonas carboxyditropha TaxID=2023338 RepID=A0A2G9WR85_9HYPH|nr:AraC family transcriptional regulator [Pleomorphomonas carboxyditropha]PIO97193.1 AraC family transcriptional regulator [Pleomorphomonas carboxyditropha]